jgi:putative salt-induced outer membrane protein YdiY
MTTDCQPRQPVAIFHGWRGNTTDLQPAHIVVIIRGTATPSVGRLHDLVGIGQMPLQPMRDFRYKAPPRIGYSVGPAVTVVVVFPKSTQVHRFIRNRKSEQMRFNPTMAALIWMLALPAFVSAQAPPDLYRLPPLEQPYQDLPAVEAAVTVQESAADEIGSEEQWFHFAPPTLVDWDGSVELGINGTEGNAQTFSLRAGASLERTTDTSIWKGELIYAKTEAASVKTQHEALLRVRYERLFASPWTWFTRFEGFYDEFRAFDIRLVLNTGLGYRFLDTDVTRLTTRAGAGVSREFGGPNDEYVPEAVLGLDFERQLTERQKFTFTGDYLPDWRDFTNYRLVSDLAWVLLLDEASDLNLKVSVIDQYDSTPEGQKPNDVTYAILLLWKL